MTKLKYKCLKCGTCCHEIIENPGLKRIPLYPEEVNSLISIAKKKKIDFTVIEDLVFPDIKNRKILVITYKINLENSERRCPFFEPKDGCIIHNTKPLSCQAYPLALKRIDAFNFQISIDPMCNFVLDNYEILKNVDMNELEEIFKEEFPKAHKFYQKNKKLQLKIKKLEYGKKIIIPRKITIENFNRYLKEWYRKEITVK
ncbi:MAG: YkgJ family cysteine cluster protein [Candidatus Thorarchaeota archaeon]